MRESRTRFSLNRNLSKHWSTFLPPLSSFIPFISVSLLILKLQMTFCHSAPVLRNSLLSDHHVAHHVTPSPILNSPVSDLSTSLFLIKLKTHLFHSFFLLCLYSSRLSQKSELLSSIDQASLFRLILISLSFTLISLMPIFIYSTCKVSMNK